MDINDFRAWHTLVLMVVFFGIIWWAYSKKRKSSFNEAANLPFADEDRHEATVKKDSNHE
ncbi:MAG: cbb3-type cytochrome c oxidase subunit 3 [Gammaproteobacteria bacterium]|nr:cbb3-type cytochrome c oxidase subunit 3 [Gammaproteobacteria bacterium]MBU1655651.1 cbb3-type cytochrome c oxidase subunit 3 [Gammaproteobacteria bacterium]MBU1960304.1 cbb3-type cytochrome c oxidase subunit 3 [Gammaproteobacteria bacterium]